MSNKKASLKNIVDSYIRLDNEIKEIEEKTKEIKKKKNTLEKYLIETFKNNKLHNKEISISNNYSLKFNEQDKKEALSQKYLKKTLETYFIKNYSHNLRKERCIEKSTEVFEYLLNNRKDKKSYSLKILNHS